MELEQQLNKILSDPDSMAQIMSLASSLGVGAPAKEALPPPTHEPPQSPNTFGGENLLQLIGKFQDTKLDPRQLALFEALKPFLSPAKQQKLDKAIQITRLSRLAEFALRNLDLNKLLESG